MKGRLAAWGCLAALGLLLARSAEAAQAVRDGLALCAGSVIPALFPFLAVSGLLTALDAGASPALGPLARLLGCSRAGARAFLLGLTGSYPVGARTVAQLYRRGGISRREACRLLLFSNNCGPAFILGVAGLGCFGSLRAGVLLWGVHILAALVIALALPRQAAEPSERPGSVPARPPLVPALIAAVRDAAGTMVYICGFVVFFLVLLRLAETATGPWSAPAAGFMELTNGIQIGRADPGDPGPAPSPPGLRVGGGPAGLGRPVGPWAVRRRAVRHGPAHGAVPGGQGRPRRRVRPAGLAGEHVPVKKERTWRCVL